MPGWYVHMDVARRAIDSLSKNSSASPIFAAGGMKPDAIRKIGRDNPAYVALGALGPDLFFLLPDFKPPVGNMLWKVANQVRETYTWWDENLLLPWEQLMGPIGANHADELNALSGGLKESIEGIVSQASAFIKDTILKLIMQQYDFFGLLSSGATAAFDEQTFFWSDMLHYRETYHFATALWQRAGSAAIVEDAGARARFQAFALGWMTHLAADVTGHAFVNQKVGGPYRLHAQRHHLVENHMDAQAYDAKHGSQLIYDQISNAALHLWIAFDGNGNSHANFFGQQPGLGYLPGDDRESIDSRDTAWDVDSAMPEDLAAFIADTMKAVYTTSLTADDNGMVACCPTIISTLDERVPKLTFQEGGFANKDDIAGAYWWVYHYLKWTTTDYYKIRRPEPPSVVIIPSFPAMPGTSDFDVGPILGGNSSNLNDALNFLLSLLAWAEWLAEVAVWPVAVIAGIVAGTITWPLREVLYEYIELPLYNMWLALHSYLAMTGYVMPMPGEIHSGLTTLGRSTASDWADTVAALGDPDGGLTAATLSTDPSGQPISGYPKDVLLDPPTLLTSLAAFLFHIGAPEVNGQVPSEFMRPWRWPDNDMQGHVVNLESPQSVAGPFAAESTTSSGLLSQPSPGTPYARALLEGATSEADTNAIAAALILNNEHLGDPTDYAVYVVARLTRENVDPTKVVNFNLDADRGYGYLCWDWKRYKDRTSTPTPSFRNQGDPSHGSAPTDASQHVYPTPIRPGYGWNPKDQLDLGGNPALTSFDPDDPNAAVTIRYIHLEKKFI